MICFNTKQKIYPDGFVRQVSCSFPVFSLHEAGEREEKTEHKLKDMSNAVRDDSVKRAMETIFDIAALNPFTHFVTWTLDMKKVDRYDPSAVKKKVKKFLNNMQQRYNLMYLVVPEEHKDGAIHFHGLVAGRIVLVDSGHKDEKGHVIYNMPQWTLGFSTAIELYGDRLFVAVYITKYITKDAKKIFGSFYFSGGGVVRKPQTVYRQLEYDQINCEEFRKVYGYKYVGFRKDEDETFDL